MAQSFWKKVWQFLLELNITYYMILQSYSQLLPLEQWKLSFTQKPVHRYVQQLYLQLPHTGYYPMPSTGEWRSKLWYIHMVAYLAIKRDELWIQATTCVTLEDIMLNKRSQTQKVTCCTLPFTWHSRKGKTVGSEKRSVIVRGWSKEKGWLQRGKKEFGGWWNCSISWIWWCSRKSI